MYEVGVVTSDKHFSIASAKKGTHPMDLDLSALFGSSPKTVMTDETVVTNYEELHYYDKSVTELFGTGTAIRKCGL